MLTAIAQSVEISTLKTSACLPSQIRIRRSTSGQTVRLRNAMTSAIQTSAVDRRCWRALPRYVTCAPMLICQHEHIGVLTTNNRACHTNFPATTKVGGSPITTGIPLVALECPTSRLNRLEAQPIPQPSRGSGHHGLPQSEAQGAHSVLLYSHTLAALRSNLWSGGKSCDARIPTTWTRCCPRRRERPRNRRAAEQRDERAALNHSITSSARASNMGGTVRPSALAVVRSMTRSNFVEARRMRVCYPSRPSA